MEPIHDTPHVPQSPGGELVVQNGRFSGSRQPMTAPLTLVGGAPECDICLKADGISPLHCALIQGPQGLAVRDLQSESGVYVNGEPVAQFILQEDDLLTIGSLHLRVHLPEPVLSCVSLEQTRDALRIQAAAVVAQQAALTEDEIHLQQQHTALERQEEQLAAHMEEKRGRLLDLQKEIREERAAMRKERADYERCIAESMHVLEGERHEVKALQEQAQTERQRFVSLQRRLRRRLERHMTAEKADLRRREEVLANERLTLEKEHEHLQKEKAALTQSRLRACGDAELGRRQIEAGWDQLRHAEERHAQQQAARQQQTQELDSRAALLAAAERDLAEQQQEWEGRRDSLEKELEGLDSRIRNQRRKLLDQKPAAASATDNTVSDPSEAASPPTEIASSSRSAAPPDDWQCRLDALEHLEGELADQRLQLAEQLERLVHLQRHGQQEREDAALELQTLAVRMQEHEHMLIMREESLAPLEIDLHRRQAVAEHRQQRLEGWQAQLTARALAWESERDAYHARLRAREEMVERQRAALNALRLRWTERRRQEVDRLRAERSWCEALRRECALLREEWFRRSEAVEQGRRALAEQVLALEQYRLELVGQAPDTVAAEKRLENLRRSWASLHTAAERTIARERRALEAETARLEERARRLERQSAGCLERDAEISNRQTSWEHQCLLAESASTELREELQMLRVVKAQHEQQIEKLRNEVERIVRLLLDDGGPDTLPLAQAA